MDEGKLVIICNLAANIMPTLIMGASGVGIGDEVIIFITPGGSQAFLKGELEKLGTPKGLPNPVELFNTILDHGGEIILCELALENKSIMIEDLRDDRIAIKNAPSFLLDAQGAGLSFVF